LVAAWPGRYLRGRRSQGDTNYGGSEVKSKLALAVAAMALLIAPVSALAASNASSSPTRHTHAADVNWQIPLVGSHAYPKATGTSQYQAQPGQSEFRVEVEHVRSLAGKMVKVNVNGATVGSIKVSRLGSADLTLNSELGQTVPNIVSGSNVTVTTSGGTLIVSGSF
jgi:hypothetical protein